MGAGEGRASTGNAWVRGLLSRAAMMVPASDLHRLLQQGEPVADRWFDELYTPSIRALSSTFWTPVRVAQRAALLLRTGTKRRVLDIGSGAGKFCLVAAASTELEVTGIEHRKHLVNVAVRAAERLGVHVRFVHGDLLAVDWAAFDSFYLYNPFVENLCPVTDRIDGSVELSEQRFRDDLQTVLEAMAHARVGTRVVTYHGLGADLPPTYSLASREWAGSGELRLWVKDSGLTHEVTVAAHP